MDWVLHGYLSYLGILIIAAALLAWFNYKLQRRYQFVPGPIGLPVLGNLHIFYWYRSAHRKLAEIAEIYGPVFSLRLGFSNVLVLSSIDSVKEALIQRGSDFSGRPSLDCLSFRRCRSAVANHTFSPTYLRNKQATIAAINISLYNSQSYELRVTSTAQELIKKFMEFQDTYFDPQPLIKSAVAELIFKILFGDELPHRYLLRAKDLAADFPYQEAFAVENSFDFLFLPRLLSVDRIQRRTDSCYIELLRFIRDVNREQTLRNTRELPRSNCTSVACFLQDSRSRRNSLPLSKDKEPEQQNLDNETIDHLLAEMFVFGCGKVSATIAWLLVFIGRDGNLQQRLHDEFNQKLSTSHFFSLADKTHLLLLEATILEVFRMCCPFPSAIPHSTIRETTVAGFKIPKNTPVFINLWACCRDSKYYRNPNVFYPFRFLDDKKEQIETLLSSPSFSLGERRCFGYGLAKGILFLLTGNLLNNFQFELHKDVSVEENLTLNPRKFQLRAQLKNSTKLVTNHLQ